MCRSLGGGEQRRDRLHADELLLAEPDRGQIAALRYFTLDGTDHVGDRYLCTIAGGANVA
jgi:hypothetical protein